MPTKKQLDPTQTLYLRLAAVAEVDKRFNEIKRVVNESIIENNVLQANAQALPPNAFIYRTDAEKLEEFRAWLQDQIDSDILQTSIAARTPRNNWLNAYVAAAFGIGVQTTRQELQALTGQELGATVGTDPNPSVFLNPAHTQRAQLLYTRVYSDLKGVTDTMSAQMSSVLADGIARGESPREVARALTNRVDKIGRTRAALIARTEIVRAHNVAAVEEAGKLAAILGEEVKMQWNTRLDGRERASHRARDGNIYERDQVEALLGEPNCRCSVSAYIPEDEKNPN